MSESRKPVLLVVIASVRDGRVGKAVGDWFVAQAESDGEFEIKVVDLKELDLPLMTEPNHPRQKAYTQDKTWEWSRLVEDSDAFAFVMPEYNFGATAPLINALDYLYQEWNHKPVLLVSYGGASGGMRAQQHLKAKITTLHMMPIVESVAIPSVAEHINDNGEFENYISAENAVQTGLTSLAKWATALRSMRG